MIGEKVLSAHPVDKANNQVGMTLYPTENGYTAVLINYDNTIHDAELTVRDGWRMEPVYGDVSRIEKCSMAVISIIRDDG